MDKLIELITEKLMAWCERRGAIFKITGTSGPDDVYLIRYFVIRSKYFNFFIHQFLRSDRDDLHDHPWHFCTYLVRGAYTEKKCNPATKSVDTVRRFSGGNSLVFVRDYGSRAQLMDKVLFEPPQNRFVFRKATDQHQVLTDHSYLPSEKKFAPLTLCFTGPTFREWGFIKNGEWIKWTKYLGLPDDTVSRG